MFFPKSCFEGCPRIPSSSYFKTPYSQNLQTPLSILWTTHKTHGARMLFAGLLSLLPSPSIRRDKADSACLHKGDYSSVSKLWILNGSAQLKPISYISKTYTRGCPLAAHHPPTPTAVSTMCSKEKSRQCLPLCCTESLNHAWISCLGQGE